MSIEHPEGNESVKNKKEALLANVAFVKFANGFKIYQDLLHDEKNQGQREEIKQRMLELYAPKPRSEDEGDNTERAALRDEIIDLINFALDECEKKSYDIESFAEKLASLSVAGPLLEEWTGEAGKIKKTDKGNETYVNEMVTYLEKDGEISLTIRPTGVEKGRFIEELYDGFKKIAQKLKDGEIKADRIIMLSWLFNKEKITKRFLGKNIAMEDDNSEDTEGSKFLALQYDNKVLKKYLETGEKLQVKRVTMTKDEFIERFLKNN